MEHTKLYINGMTCINCQTRIQKALKTQPGIVNSTVSYQTGIAELDYEPDQISLDQILHLIDELGYDASIKKASRTSSLLRILRELGIILLLYFLLQHFGILNRLAPTSLANAQMGYGMLFVIGLITSVHCIAMCGGINLSQVLQKETDSSANVSRVMFQNAAAYNVGRVISYTITGGIFGAIGALTGFAGTLQTSSLIQGLLKLLAGALMVLMGINMLGLFPGLRKLRLRPHLSRFVRYFSSHFLLHFQRKNLDNQDTSKASKKEAAVPRKSKTPFVVGLFNGLMPCGPLQSMQIVALASANVVTGALSMFFFALGTVPLMLGFGSVIASLGKRFTKQVLTYGAILVTVMGLSMMSQGTALSGINSMVSTLLPNQQESIAANSNADTAVEKDGVQYLSSTLESGTYPDITVKAGVPVKWTIHADKSSINGCNYKVLLQDFNTECVFKEGDNVIEFTPQKEGVYTYSCWMGMITGKIHVV